MKHTCSSLETKKRLHRQRHDIIGNKWTALILRDLADGVNRFTDLEQSITGINPRTLSQRLDDLENQLLSVKKASPKYLRISNTP